MSKLKTPRHILAENGKLAPPQIAALRSSSLFIATPAYGGMVLAPYTDSLLKFQSLLTSNGGKMRYQPLVNESLIQRARDTMAALFLETDCEYLLFIDSDILFEPTHLLEMYLAALMSKQKIVGASYPKKTFNFSGIRAAIANGIPDNQIEHCSGAHNVRYLGDASQELVYLDLNPVKYLPTGFLLIHRHVFLDMVSITTPYKINTFASPTQMYTRNYFQCPVIDEELLSEDYFFCLQAAKLGIPINYAPWVQLTHYGTYGYRGCNFCSSGNVIHTFEPQK